MISGGNVTVNDSLRLDMQLKKLQKGYAMSEIKQLAAAMAPIPETMAKKKGSAEEPVAAADVTISAPGLKIQIGRAEIYTFMEFSQQQIHALQLKVDSLARDVSKILSGSD